LRKRLFRFNGTVNLGQIDARRRTREARAKAHPFASLHQTCPLKGGQQPPDYYRIGIDAFGKHSRSNPIPILVTKDSQHMHGHRESATGSHLRFGSLMCNPSDYICQTGGLAPLLLLGRPPMGIIQVLQN
jgi:hypothetical protein